jgi:hypothetical protein
MHAVAIPAPIYVPWEVRESAAQQRRSGVSPGPLARWGVRGQTRQDRRGGFLAK